MFAAASLHGAFTTIGKQFEAAHPGTTVKFSFGPSSGLADQIKSGRRPEGQGHQDPDQRQRLDGLSDRDDQEVVQHADGGGVRLLCAVVGRSEGARQRRVREAIAAGLEKAAPAATTRLSARDRIRRAERGGGSRSAPVSLLAPGLLAVAFLVLPLIGLVIRAPWDRLGAVLSRSDALQALELSLWTASLATGISLLIGVPLAWLLARTTFPGQRLLRALRVGRGAGVAAGPMAAGRGGAAR